MKMTMMSLMKMSLNSCARPSVVASWAAVRRKRRRGRGE
jgi:hypothetical protein